MKYCTCGYVGFFSDMSNAAVWKVEETEEEEEEEEDVLPHQNQATWLVHRTMERQEAEFLLRNRPPGTFLVRLNDQNLYVLSIM